MAFMALGRRVRVAWGAAMASLLVSAALSGCTSVSQINAVQLQPSEFVADHLPTWANGEPSDVPSRPAEQPAYPNVSVTPPVHNRKLLTDEEEQRAEADLAAARSGTTARIAASVTAEQQRAAETAALVAAHERMAVQQSTATTSN